MGVEDIIMEHDVPELIKMHDTLMRLKPSKATHDQALCVLCNGTVDGAETTTEKTTPGGGDMSQYTEEDLQAAVANAIKPLQDELAATKASQEQAAIEGRIAEITETHEAQLAEVQGQLDTATAASEAAVKQYDELTSFLTEEQEKVELEVALATRTDEVRTVVGERFDVKYVDQHIERWASLEAEAFDAMILDWDASAAAVVAQGGETTTKKDPLKSSAMTASSSEEGSPNQKTINLSDARKNLMRNRNFRSIRAHS